MGLLRAACSCPFIITFPKNVMPEIQIPSRQIQCKHTHLRETQRRTRIRSHAVHIVHMAMHSVYGIVRHSVDAYVFAQVCACVCECVYVWHIVRRTQFIMHLLPKGFTHFSSSSKAREIEREHMAEQSFTFKMLRIRQRQKGGGRRCWRRCALSWFWNQPGLMNVYIRSLYLSLSLSVVTMVSAIIM